MACVYREMAKRSKELKNYKFDTLYIGGGTPSVIDEKYIAMLIASAKKNFNLAPDAEITIEMNPGTVSESKIRAYKQCGINRFSVGLQTAVDSQLSDLGRVHDLKAYIHVRAYARGRDARLHRLFKRRTPRRRRGRSNVRCGSRKARFARLRKVRSFQLLQGRKKEQAQFKLLAQGRIYRLRRFKCILSDCFAVIDSEEIDREGQEEEYIMLRLRTSDGIDLNEFKKLFGCEFTEKYSVQINKLKDSLDRGSDSIKIKDEFLFVQNSIIVEFFN